PFFDFAHAAEVFLKLLPVSGGKLALECAGILEHEIENGPLLLSAAHEALASLPGRAGAKEPLEEEPWIGFGRHGLARGAPGKVVLIGAGVARIAVAGFAHGV